MEGHLGPLPGETGVSSDSSLSLFCTQLPVPGQSKVLTQRVLTFLRSVFPLKQMNESLLGGLNELQAPSIPFQLMDFEKAAPHVPISFLGYVAKRRLKCSHLCESCHRESLKLGSEVLRAALEAIHW